MKERKKIICICIAIAIVIIGVGGYIFISQQKSAEKTFTSYIEAVDRKEYEKAYETIASSSKWKKADFIKRIKNIYEGIDMQQMKVEVNETSKKKDTTTLTYDVDMDTIAGALKYRNEIKVVKEDGEYKLVWDSSQVLPNLGDDERVSVQVLQGKRGAILDRNGEAIAKQGSAYNVGFVAGELGDQEQASTALADVLGMQKATIDKKLSASWIQDGMFVPIKTISVQEKEALYERLKQISGVSVQFSEVRTYPYGEMLAHVSGYVQSISQEELKKHKKEGYDEHSIIGKAGLEQVFEKQLKPRDGYSINILHTDGTNSTVLLKKDAKNGKDMTTTIDIVAQQAVYAQLKEDAGAGVMMDTHTGEVLAMVSTPSYDPNAFVLGLSNEAWNAINNDTLTPMMNRTTSRYSPGSTFKAITGAIGIDSATIQSDTTYDKVEKWQKDKSWGDNYVTTTKSYQEPSDLLHAYMYSDNIYFARLADQIGKEKYANYLDKIGFNKAIKFTLALDRSTYGSLDSDQKLAAAGYGQGELLVSPLHLTALYTAYKNDGTIVKPYLLYDQGKQHVLAKQAFKKGTASLIFEDLKQTMDTYGVNSTNAAGKTGTAQVKKGEQEIGWICTVNDRYAMSMMVDDTKNIGQSHYIIPKAQAILESYK